MKSIINVFKAIPILALALITFWVGRKTAPKPPPQIIVKVDTLEVQPILHDTIIKWYEKIKWKKSKPDTIIQYKADTIPITLPEKVILTVDYKYPKLMFLDNYARVHIHNNVGDEFSIRTLQNGFFVKSHQSKFHWYLSTGCKIPLTNWWDGIYIKGNMNIYRFNIWALTTTRGLDAGIGIKLWGK